MDADAIKQLLAAQGVGANSTEFVLECADRDYSLPAAEWVFGSFATFWAGKREQLGLAYDPETEDCDDFARLAAAFAALLHAQTPDRPANTALAFGECWFEQDNGDWHAINAFITTDAARAPRLMFFEPQTSLPLKLSDNEVRNISFLRF